MREETLKWLYDARKAASTVQRFVRGKTFSDYSSDELLRSGVERQLGIVGEALARIRRKDPEVLQRIREHRSIISFRNILVHNYDGLDHRIVWSVIRENLETLVEDLAEADTSADGSSEAS